MDPKAVPLPPKVSGMNLKQRMTALQNFHIGAADLRDHGGPVVQVPVGPNGLTPRFVVVTSPSGAHDLLGGHDGTVDKGLVIQAETRRAGLNSFNMEHAEWVPRRRTLSPLFTKKRVADFATHMGTAAADTAERAIAAGRVELDPLARKLTLQVLGRSVLGLDLGERSEEIGPDIHTMLTFVTSRGTAPMRLPYRLPTPKNRSFRNARTRIFALLDEAVENTVADPDNGALLIKLLLEAKDPESGAALTRDDILGELWAFLVAGHDTTATTLAYSMWALGRDAELQDRVAAEILALGERPLTAADVPALDLTVRVLHETMRMCPPAAALGRLAVKDTVIDGYRVPKGSNIFLGIRAMHLDPTLWDEPTRFDPDRFTPENSAGRSRWQYLPFGGGPRSCVGDHFAMLEATLGLATIIRAARIESLEAEFPIAFPFTMTAGGPIPARFTRR